MFKHCSCFTLGIRFPGVPYLTICLQYAGAGSEGPCALDPGAFESSDQCMRTG